jgi:protease I
VKKILMLIDNGAEDSEFIYPYYRFQEEGYKVDVVGAKANETYVGKHGVPLKSNLSPEQVKLAEYDAIVIPGGKAPDIMRTNNALVQIVKDAYQKRKVIAAICHGPQMLIEADVLRGKKATCWKSVATDLKNAGATFIDAPAVADGNLVTSRFPADLPQFCQEALKLLKKR